MESVLIAEMVRVVVFQYPEIISSFPDNERFDAYLLEQLQILRPIFEEYCQTGIAKTEAMELTMKHWAQILGPSKYNFIEDILEAEFEDAYNDYEQMGLLQLEVMNLADVCSTEFERFGFDADDGNRLLYYGIVSRMEEHFKGEAKLIKDGVQ